MTATISNLDMLPQIFIEMAAGTSPTHLNAAAHMSAPIHGDGAVRPTRLFCGECGEFIAIFTAWDQRQRRTELPKAVDYANQTASSKVRRHREDRHKSAGLTDSAAASVAIQLDRSVATSVPRKRKASGGLDIAIMEGIDSGSEPQPPRLQTVQLGGVSGHHQRVVVARTDERGHISSQAMIASPPLRQQDQLSVPCQVGLQRQSPGIPAGQGLDLTLNNSSVPIGPHYMPGMPITLPCLLQLSTVHSQYGLHQVWAVLYHTDEQTASNQPLPTEVHRKPHLADVLMEPYRLVDDKLGTEARCLYHHQIVHVFPMATPFSVYVGRWFSSFAASARLLGKTSGAGMGWKICMQPSLPLAQAISECGFRNPDVKQAV